MDYQCKNCSIYKNRDDFYVINKFKKSICKECRCAKKSEFYFSKNNRRREYFIDREKILLEKCYNLFGELYDYKKLKYKGSLEKVIVTCKEHGDFLIRTNHLSKGHGCPKCGNMNKGYNRNRFIENSNNSYCYIIICEDENECFMKVGITRKKISERFNSNTSMPYNYKEHVVISGDPSYIFDLEKLIHKKLNEIRYLPRKKFSGSKNECFELIGIKIIDNWMKHSFSIIV